MPWWVTVSNMPATLGPHRSPRFSETARSRPRHLEADRDGVAPRAGAVGRRRTADDGGEGAAEGPEAGEADLEADLGDAQRAVAQQRHGALDPAPLQVAMRRLAEHGR